MIKGRIDLITATEYVKKFFLETKEEIMWRPHGYPMFATIVPSQMRHTAQIPGYPAMIDHKTRLDLLNVLCIVGCDEAKELAKRFLEKEITGASVLLLQEGDQSALDLIRAFLQDDNEKIRMQAALVLAFYGGDPSVADILVKAFPKVEWDKKIQILEALGAIGNRDVVPFLVETMQSPFTLLRIVAASSVIRCLYH